MDISPELIQKYLKDECTQEEIAVVNAWYNSFESGQDPFAILSEFEQADLKQRMLGQIRVNMGMDEEGKDLRSEKRSLVRTLFYPLSAVAALFLVVLGISLFKQTNWSGKPGGITEKITVQNLTSSIHKTILSDSSIVWLSPRSKLQYPKYFKGHLREVQMEGEAFFEVTKDSRHPFVIRSGEVITKVLGTSFRIRAYSGANTTEVSVVTGRVTVALQEDNNSLVTVLPSNKVTYLKGSHLLEKGTEESVSMKIWKRASMSFENIPVSEVIRQLNKRFSINISTEDTEISNYVLTADFSDQNLPDIMEMLERSLNISYELGSKNIVLKKTKKPIK